MLPQQFLVFANNCNRLVSSGYENVTKKVNSRYFKLYRAYFISFNSSNVGEFFWSFILKDSIEVQEKKNKVVLCSRTPENVKLGCFTS